jgi:hypothetical protein
VSSSLAYTLCHLPLPNIFNFVSGAFVASRVLGVCLSEVLSFKGERCKQRIRGVELVDGNSKKEPRDFLPCRPFSR